jgi:hypothetical protein
VSERSVNKGLAAQVIAALEGDLLELKRQLGERDGAAAERERHVAEVKRRNGETEKARFVAEHRLQELKQAGEPRDAELARLRALLQARMHEKLHAGPATVSGCGLHAAAWGHSCCACYCLELLS